MSIYPPNPFLLDKNQDTIFIDLTIKTCHCNFWKPINIVHSRYRGIDNKYTFWNKRKHKSCSYDYAAKTPTNPAFKRYCYQCLSYSTHVFKFKCIHSSQFNLPNLGDLNPFWKQATTAANSSFQNAAVGPSLKYMIFKANHLLSRRSNTKALTLLLLKVLIASLIAPAKYLNSQHAILNGWNSQKHFTLTDY